MLEFSYGNKCPTVYLKKISQIFTGIADSNGFANTKQEFGQYCSSLPVIHNTYLSVPKELIRDSVDWEVLWAAWYQCFLIDEKVGVCMGKATLHSLI